MSDELTQSLERRPADFRVCPAWATDMRTVVAAAGEGNERAAAGPRRFRAPAVQGDRRAGGRLQRLDALVFTGGIGENSAAVRGLVLGRLGFLGLAEGR